MTVAATIKLLGAAEFKKSIDGMGATVAKMNKTAMDPKSLRSMSKETTTLQKQMESFKGTVSKTDPALAKVRNELAANMRTLRSAGVDVRKLDGDFKRLNTTQNTARNNWAKFGSAMKTSGAVIGGAVAAGYMIAQPIKQQMAWDERIDKMTLTALPRGSQAEHDAMKSKLKNAVDAAGEYGGDRDNIALTMDTIIASGKMTPDQTAAILPWLNKAAVASGASSVDLANIITRLGEFGISGEENIKQAINMAMAAGQAGGFELKDMARWLPEQLAIAKTSGMYGIEHYKTILATNQAAMLTAGTTDAAGNNIKNMYQKLGSKETRDRAEKEFGINLDSVYMDAIKRGMNPQVAMTGILQQKAEADPRYKALQKKLQTAQSKDEKTNVLNEMGKMMGVDENGAISGKNLIMGGVIGQLFNDQQAVLGLLAAMNREYIVDVEKQIDAGGGSAVDHAYGRISDSAWLGAQKSANKLAATKSNAYDQIEGSLSGVLTKINAYADVYPGLTTALYGATEVVKALAVAGLVTKTTGGLFGAGKTASTLAPLAAVPSVAQKAGWFGKIPALGMVAKWTPQVALLNLPTAAATGGFDEEKFLADADQKRAKVIEDAGGEAAAREAYDWWGGILPFDMVNTNKIEKAVVAYKEYQSTTPTPSMYSLKPNIVSPIAVDKVNNAGMQGQLESFLKSLSTEGQPDVESKAVVPQINDNSQRTIQINLGVIDPTQLVPLVKRTIEEQLVAEKNNRRGDQFDTMEAIG